MKVIFFLALLTVSSPILANCSGNSCNPVKITRLILGASGDIQIGTSGDESKLSCDAGNNGYLVLRKEHANFQAIYSLLLTAQTVEHPLWLRLTESGVCEIIYVVSDK